MFNVFSSDLVKSVASSRRISGAFASERSNALVKTALATVTSMTGDARCLNGADVVVA